MPVRGSCRIALSLWALTSACSIGSDPTGPVSGTLEITFSTTGRDPDPDGYSVTVDGGSPLAVPSNGSVSIPDLANGVHTVTLTGLAGNCALTTPAPLEVRVFGALGGVANVKVTCSLVYTLAYRGELGVELTDAAGTVHRTLLANGNISWRDTDPLAWSPDGRLLAVRKNDLVARVWLANLDDISFTQLYSVGDLLAWNLVGAWSPDGRELLLNVSSGGHTSFTRLTRYPVDESYPPQTVYEISQGMTGPRVFCPALARGVLGPDWSPDASQIVMCEQSQMYILSRDGTTKRLLAEGMQPDWSPEGSAIVYVGPVAGPATLRLIHPDGTNDRQLTAPPPNETDAGPAWSPDGSKVAFVRLGHGPDGSVTSVHAYVVNRDGTNEQQLAVLPVSNFLPSWSADGLHLAYSGDGIYVIKVDGTGFRQISPGYGAQWRP